VRTKRSGQPVLVVVEALNKTGLIGDLAHYLAQGASTNPNQIAAFAGEAVALASNLVNKLPPH
jgi:Na+/H+ antiporter NhaD/arsenite permease-like protein